MSISFANGHHNIQLLIDSDKNNTVAKTVFNQLITMFDGHYLNYIAYRKQRDLMIVNCFYKMIIRDVKINKKHIEKYQFSSLVDVKNGFDFERVVPISQKETIIALEREISVLKAFYLFHADLKKCFSNFTDIGCIEAKIKKVQQLNDEAMFARITTSETIKKNIMQEIGKMNTYEEVRANENLYRSLKDSLNFK